VVKVKSGAGWAGVFILFTLVLFVSHYFSLSFPNASVGINLFATNLNMLRIARRVAHMDVGYI